MPPTRGSAERIPHTPEHRRDIAIASACQAFAVLCEALTELADIATKEIRENMVHRD